MNKSKGFIFLSSEDRNFNENTREITFNIDIPNITKIGLSSYDVLYGIQNINNNNNIGYMETATQTFPIALPNGYYNWSDLVSAIDTVLNGLGIGVFTVTFTDNIFAILAPEPIKFITNVRGDRKDWLDMVGLLKNQPLTNNPKSVCADIAYTNKLFITSEEIHRNRRMRDFSSNARLNNVLATVYLNANESISDEKIDKPENITRPHHATSRIENVKWIERNARDNLGPITIRILDDSGTLIPLDNEGAGWGAIRWSIELQYETD